MKIITISREFGSGGRELGKRMADLLDIDYYDREIITAIAEKKNLDETFVESSLNKNSWKIFPLTFRRSFSMPQLLQIDMLLAQKHVIEDIAQKGRDCIIVGRNADVLLKQYGCFNIFVCADMQVKIRRCIERAEKYENLSHKSVENNIRRIDKSRLKTRELLSGASAKDKSNYHLTINTSEWTIKELAPAVANFTEYWFRRNE